MTWWAPPLPCHAQVEDQYRGRALGLLTLASKLQQLFNYRGRVYTKFFVACVFAVGGAPFGCAALGELAQTVGANRALFWFSLCGAATQCFWVGFRPGAIRITRPD